MNNVYLRVLAGIYIGDVKYCLEDVYVDSSEESSEDSPAGEDQQVSHHYSNN